MELHLSCVNLEFVYLFCVILFYVLDRLQGRTVSLIGYIIYKYIWNNNNMTALTVSHKIHMDMYI